MGEIFGKIRQSKVLAVRDESIFSRNTLDGHNVVRLGQHDDNERRSRRDPELRANEFARQIVAARERLYSITAGG
jgi:hypothetical protein